MSEENTPPHILLTSIGVSGPKPTKYVMEERNGTGLFSAFGLWHVLPDDQRPDEIWFLLTPKARDTTWDEIKSEAAQIGVSVHAIDLAGNIDDTHEFLEQTASSIPVGAQLTLNVTEGLRHHAFLFYALALYLTAFRGVRVKGAWYCRLETADREDPKPVINLKPVLDLAHWFHALAVFRETGSLREVARQISDGDARQLINDLSLLFQNGMPVEAGDVAARLVAGISNAPHVTNVPLAGELQELILSGIDPLAGAEFDAHPTSDRPAKKSLPLTMDELSRQAEFIDRYFDTGQINLAFGLVREWVVNWILLQRENDSSWLERSTRMSIEYNLGGLGEVFRAKDPTDPRGKRYKHASVRDRLNEEQREWAKRWNSICDIRNALQHHGMKPAAFQPHRSDIAKMQADWKTWRSWSAVPEFGGGSGRLLICPIGMTPGVLFSAIQRTKPDRILIVCSDDSETAIDEAIEKSGYASNAKRIVMADVHTGVEEFDALIDEASVWLFDADSVHANLTGGTTLMGVFVSRLVQRAGREYQRSIHEFVLIDKRSPEEQRANPWQLGEIWYLDKEAQQKNQ